MRRNSIIVATLLVVAVTAACTGPADDPERPSTTASASVSSTPTLDPAEAARQKNIDDATTTLMTYVDLDNDLSQAGFVDWSPLNLYLSGDLRPAVIAAYESYAEGGLRQTGELTVEDLRVVDYAEGASGSASISFEGCMDTSEWDIVKPDGSSIVEPGQADRTLAVYRMTRQEDGRWTVDATESGGDQRC